ncbi:MAG: hypothetical protein IPO92_19120 [Saprospiraceae bacterium]|nr:hypothetical protein [Saprospiraceae bacterium]
MHISTFGRGLWTTLKYTSCTDNLMLSGEAVGRNYYEASGNIQSTQTILSSPGTNIIYSAGNKITFSTGTHIQNGAKFKGYAQPCGSEVDLAKPSVKNSNHLKQLRNDADGQVNLSKQNQTKTKAKDTPVQKEESTNKN